MSQRVLLAYIVKHLCLYELIQHLKLFWFYCVTLTQYHQVLYYVFSTKYLTLLKIHILLRKFIECCRQYLLKYLWYPPLQSFLLQPSTWKIRSWVNKDLFISWLYILSLRKMRPLLSRIHIMHDGVDSIHKNKVILVILDVSPPQRLRSPPNLLEINVLRV